MNSEPTEKIKSGKTSSYFAASLTLSFVELGPTEDASYYGPIYFRILQKSSRYSELRTDIMIDIVL